MMSPQHCWALMAERCREETGGSSSGKMTCSQTKLRAVTSRDEERSWTMLPHLYWLHPQQKLLWGSHRLSVSNVKLLDMVHRRSMTFYHSSLLYILKLLLKNVLSLFIFYVRCNAEPHHQDGSRNISFRCNYKAMQYNTVLLSSLYHSSQCYHITLYPSNPSHLPFAIEIRVMTFLPMCLKFSLRQVITWYQPIQTRFWREHRRRCQPILPLPQVERTGPVVLATIFATLLSRYHQCLCMCMYAWPALVWDESSHNLKNHTFTRSLRISHSASFWSRTW